MFFDGGEYLSTEGNISLQRGMFFEGGERKTLKTGDFCACQELPPDSKGEKERFLCLSGVTS